jgi:hypothetical protein
MKYAQADDPFIYIPKPQPDPLSPETNFITQPSQWVILVINLLLIGVTGFGVISLIVAGIRFMASRGDIKATQVAKTQLTYSIVALTGGVLALTMLRILVNSLGIDDPGKGINNYLGI